MSSSFPQYFQYISNFKSQFIYSFVKCGCSIYFFFIFFFFFLYFYFFFFFLQFCKSDMSRYEYLEVFKRIYWTEITRVDCTFANFIQPIVFFFFFFFFLFLLFFSSPNVSTWYWSDICPSKIFMSHVTTLRLFEDTDTDLVRGHDRCKSKLYPFSFSLFKYKTTTQNISYR